VQLSSGTYVLERSACAAIAGDRRTDVPDLVSTLIARAESVVAFPHSAAWIDVNDAVGLRDAEKLVLEHYRSFECWHREPDDEVAGLLVRGPAGVLGERRVAFGRRSPQWGLPVVPMASLGRQGPLRTQPVASFDDLDTEARRLIRYHIIAADAGEPVTSMQPGSERRWIHPDESDGTTPCSPMLARCLAMLGKSL
jgi:hypothetical protein